MKTPKTPQELYETTHLTDPAWDGLDEIPKQEDGRPGWDTAASAADPDDEDIQSPHEKLRRKYRQSE